jgi:hypothetical protein
MLTRILAAAAALALTAPAAAELGDFIGSIPNPGPQTGDRFGQALASNGTALAVGAPTDETGGRVHLFQMPSTTRTALFQPPNSINQVQFGRSIQFLPSNNRIAIGAPRVVVSSVAAGAVYIHPLAGGSALRTIPNPDPTGAVGGGGPDGFGSSLALAGTVLAVGAFGNDIASAGTNGIDAGSVYLFDAASPQYTFLREIQCPNPVSLAYFGTSIAATGNELVIGAPGQLDNGNFGAGLAYVCNASTGAVRATLKDPFPEPAGSFGQSVAASGFRVLVGAPYSSRFGSLAGVAYLFDINPANPGGTPILVATLRPPAGSTQSAFFGAQNLFTAEHIAVSAPGIGEVMLFPLTVTGTTSSPVKRIVRSKDATSEWGTALAETPGRLHVGDYRYFVSPHGPDVGVVDMHQLVSQELPPTGFLIR